MFTKNVSIAIIILCLGIIGCTEPNVPAEPNVPVNLNVTNLNDENTYTVVTILDKPIDYWIEQEVTWLLRQVHVDENGKIDKVFFDSYGELNVTYYDYLHNDENRICFKLNELNEEHDLPFKLVSIWSGILGDTMIGSFGREYWSEDTPIESTIVYERIRNFIAVRK